MVQCMSSLLTAATTRPGSLPALALALLRGLLLRLART